MSALVLTIGQSTRTTGKFADLLREVEVDLVVDVRRFPRSRRNSSSIKRCWSRICTRETAPATLNGEDLEAAGTLLRLPNADWRNPAFRGYADHMFRPELAIMVYTPLS